MDKHQKSNLVLRPRRALKLLLELGLVAVIPAAKADILDSWHWRNPSPFANSLRSTCFGAGKFVGVGDGGIIHNSPDGVTWDDGRRTLTSTLHKVIFVNGQFVAVGDAGVIATSSDGYSWTSHASGTTNALYGVAYGNGEYVACGAAGQLTSSTNGLIWTPGSVGTSDLNWITFGNGFFVIAAPNISEAQMAVRVSANGQTWTTQPFPPGTGFFYPNVLYEAVFANGLFVATARIEYHPSTTIYQPRIRFFTSSDATSWFGGGMADGSYDTNYFNHHFLTFANGAYYEFTGPLTPPYSGGSRVPYTLDGTAISTALAPDEAYDSTSMSYANGMYVLTALNGKLWSSNNGTNWTPQYGGFRTNVNRIIRGADRFLAVGSGPNGVPILTSSDGINFTVLPSSPVLAYGEIAFDGSNYVAVAAAGSLYTSSDGINWTQRTSNTADDLLAICRGSNRWVAVGRGGAVISSPNTLAWTLRTSGTANALKGVTYGNGTYVAIGDGGTIITSADAATWEAQFSETAASLNGIGFFNDKFIAVGANGTILTSMDGSSWQPQNSPGTGTFKSVALGDGRLVVCGLDPVLLQSTNATDWQDITTKIPAYVGLNAIAFLDGSFYVCGANGSILQSDSTDHLVRIGGAMLADNSGFQVKINLNVPPTYRIQASSNLMVNSWEDLASLANPVSPYVWTDTNALTFTKRFYRIVSP